MAGIFMAKRATTTINRASIIKDHGLPGPFFFSTAYERAQASNAVSKSTRAARDTAGQGMNEAAASQQSPDIDVSQFIANTAKESVRKATEVAGAVGDTAKKTLDGAWQTAKDANQMVRDTATGNGNGNEIDEDGITDNQFVDEMQNIDGPVDMVEYRNMEDNFEESKKTGDEAN